MADFSVKEYTLPQRWKLFQFYGFGGAVTSYLSHHIAQSTLWKLAEIRIAFSAAIASVKYLNVFVSAAQGSYYDLLLLSYNVQNSTWVNIYYSDPLVFQSDDTVEIYTSVMSVATTYGVQAIGWAVTG